MHNLSIKYINYICNLMKTIFTITLLAMAGLIFAQKQDGPPPPDKGSKTRVLGPNQERAKPDYDFAAYLKANIKYPKAALEAEIEGKVVVEFIIEKDGSVSGIRVVNGQQFGGGLQEEAIRVIKNMPPWKPAMQNGQIVRSYMTQPVDFKLKEKSLLNSKYQFPVDKGVTLIQGAFPAFNYQDYIEKNKVYPSKAAEKEIEGLVAIQFIVETNGRISNITIAEGKDLGYGLPEEALRLIKNMPLWNPALDINKKKVRSYVIVPVFFKRNDK